MCMVYIYFYINPLWSSTIHNIYHTTILDVIIQCELGREPGGQTSLPDNNLVLVSVNDINSFMTILIIIMK
jgi:hypothetical protein